MGILSWFSSSKSNAPTRNNHTPKKTEYPLLPAAVVSAHNELIKIQNDTVYEIYFIPQRNEFIVKTDVGCKRFLATGKLIDEFWGDGGAHPCGASFHSDGFVDWALTCNPELQPFADNVDLDKRDLTGFAKRFQLASSRHVQEEKTRRLFYIKEGDSWIKVSDHNKHDDKPFWDTPQSATPLIKLARNEPDWELLQFQQDSATQPAAVPDRNAQSQGDIGIAGIALPFNAETLHCSLHMARDSSDTPKKDYHFDAAVYFAPANQAKADTAQFIHLYTRKLRYRPREEQGLYVVRSRIPSEAQDNKNHTLGLKYLGDTAAYVCWQAMHYATAASEYFDNSHRGTVTERKRQLPTIIDCVWHSTAITTDKTLLQCGSTLFSAERSIAMQINLTKSNLPSALKKLDVSQPTWLSMESQAVDGGYILQLSVSDNTQTIYLHNYTLERQNDASIPNTATCHEFTRNALTQLLTSNPSSTAFYVQYALSLPDSVWQDQAAEHAYTLSNNMHTALAQGDMDVASQWFTVFDRCLSQQIKEHTPLLEFVAADMVVVAIEKAQASLYEKVRERLLDNKPVNSITDARLLFNMACYAARSNNKPALLELTRQALAKGKSESDFIDDNDFAHFKNDNDFTRLLHEKLPIH